MRPRFRLIIEFNSNVVLGVNYFHVISLAWRLVAMLDRLLTDIGEVSVEVEHK